MPDNRDSAKPADNASASCVMGGQAGEIGSVHGRYHVECLDQSGQLKWVEDFDNVVTTVGKNDMLDTYFRGAAYTQTVRMGLKGTGTAVVGDTQASHGSWSEVGLANAPTYTGSRKDVTLGAAAAGVSTSAAQAFAITSTGTVAGCFVNNGGSATKDNTTGVLYSAGDFSLARSVLSGDTLNVTYSSTLT